MTTTRCMLSASASSSCSSPLANEVKFVLPELRLAARANRAECAFQFFVSCRRVGDGRIHVALPDEGTDHRGVERHAVGLVAIEGFGEHGSCALAIGGVASVEEHLCVPVENLGNLGGVWKFG
jgi:hypothetical protein